MIREKSLRRLPPARWRLPKVFCVGFNKTGTTSVSTVLQRHGFKLGDQSRGEALLAAWSRRDFGQIARFCRSAQAFQDVPFSLPYTFQALDQIFPQSKFILTERETPEQWYGSLVRFHSRLWADGVRECTARDLKDAPYRYRGFAYDYQTSVFGTPDDDLYNEEALKAVYLRHNHSVKDYFRNRPDDLIVINLSRKPDYQRLCGFLDVESSEQDFPWDNRTA